MPSWKHSSNATAVIYRFDENKIYIYIKMQRKETKMAEKHTNSGKVEKRDKSAKKKN